MTVRRLQFDSRFPRNACDMPTPSDTITITAVVPIITPSTVSVVRKARCRSDERLEATRSEKRISLR